MRPSTQGNNFKVLIKEEFVKRFEQTVIDQIKQYEDCQKQNEKNILIINIRLDEIQKQQKEFESLIVNAKKDLCLQFFDGKNDIFEKFEFHRTHCNEQISVINNLAKELVGKSAINATKNDLLDNVSMLQSQMINIDLNAEKEKRRLSELIYAVKKEIFDYVKEFENNMLDNISKLSNELVKTNENIDTFKIDSTSVLKELQVYKKNVFILEKKIEHIFTLIDRSKRGGLLARPEY